MSHLHHRPDTAHNPSPLSSLCVQSWYLSQLPFRPHNYRPSSSLLLPAPCRNYDQAHHLLLLFLLSFDTPLWPSLIRSLSHARNVN